MASRGSQRSQSTTRVNVNCPVSDHRVVDAADIGGGDIATSGQTSLVPADGNHIAFAGDAGIADVDIIAAGGLFIPAPAPNARLFSPVLFISAKSPTAVLLIPLMLLERALSPKALLEAPLSSL